MARLAECRSWPSPVSPSQSLAVRAFQLSMAAAQNRQPIDYWEYLEHIEAPQWVDLTVEASLEGTEGDDPWFYQHHPHHETPLEELVFGLSRDEDFVTSTANATTSSDHSLSLESSQESGELKKHENGRLCASKAELRSACRIRNSDEEVVNHEKDQTQLSSSPNESFSTKLLATLMARLRASEEVQTMSSRDSSLSEPKLARQMKSSNVTGVPAQGIRGSAGLASGARNEASKPTRKVLERSTRGNKENSRTPSRGEKSALNLVKKPKLMAVRKSLASFEFGKNSNATFSVGRNDGSLTPQRRRLSCKSPRLKNGKFLRPSNTKRLPQTSTKDGNQRSTGHDLKMLQNSSKPKYEPRLHSTRDIRQWERRSGQQYYSLQPMERVKVNQEITELKRSKAL